MALTRRHRSSPLTRMKCARSGSCWPVSVSLSAALLASAMVAACHSSPADEREAAAKRALAEGSASATPSAAPVAREAAPARTALASPPSGEAVTSVTLLNGAKLTLPEGAIEKPFDAAKRLPSEVKKAHLFHLGSKDRLFMVNEMELVNDSCQATLDKEKNRMRAAQDDADPQRLEYRKMGAFETFEIGGHRVLYGESKNRGLGPADGMKRPMVAMATMLMCRDKHYVAMMYVSQQTELPTGMKKALSDVVASYAK